MTVWRRPSGDRGGPRSALRGCAVSGGVLGVDMLERRAHARGLVAWIDVDERHEGGSREVLGGALAGQDGIALLGGLEDPGVIGLDEPDVMRELAAVLQVEQPVALGVAPEFLDAPDQPGAGVREQS